MKVKGGKGGSEQNTLPENFVVGKSDIECLFISALNIQTNIDELKEVSKLEQVDYYEKDPTFYNDMFEEDTLVIPIQTEVKMESLLIDEITKDKVSSTEFYEEMISKGKIDLFKDVSFDELVYILPNGGFVYKLRFHLNKEMDVDDFIFFTNCVIKLNPTICPVNNENFSVIDRCKNILNLAKKQTDIVLYTDSIEKYSLLLIHRLGQEIEDILSRNPKLRRSIYDFYTNQIHALSVRTVERWKKRFPPDVSFPDKNIATSSVGFIRINFRNSVLYEFPYSEKTVRNLYSFAMTEIRAWNFLANTYLMRTQKLIDKLAKDEITLSDIQNIENLRHEILDTLDEFNDHITCPSFRARNFYSNAIRILGINEITNALKEKINDLDSIIQQQHNTRQRKESDQRNKQLNILAIALSIFGVEELLTSFAFFYNTTFLEKILITIGPLALIIIGLILFYWKKVV